MKINFDRRIVLQILIVLLFINYMIVTVILGDPTILKYLRDMVLIVLVIYTVRTGRLQYKDALWLVLSFAVFAFMGVARGITLKLGITVLRKIFFPLLLFIVVCNMDMKKDFSRFLKFICIFFVIMSLWGVFQAHILGDEFLKGLGYPAEYHHGYKKVMLYNSYYFGNLGIQRVVSTLSNSNICGLILGTTLLMLLISYPYIKGVKYKFLTICIIGVAYLLTFSRSNFLALLIVGLFIVLPYIPRKEYFAMIMLVGIAAVVVVGIAQGEDGIVYKLLIWVQNTFNFTESSVAGRSSRWSTALEAVIQNPMGIGYGHVGSIASEAGIVEGYYSCENSYLALALDNGWVACIMYYGYLIYLICKLRNYAGVFKRKGDRLTQRVCIAGYAIILYMMIVMLFSNHIYDMEAVAIIYIYVGIALNIARKSKREMLQKEEENIRGIAL